MTKNHSTSPVFGIHAHTMFGREFSNESTADPFTTGAADWSSFSVAAAADVLIDGSSPSPFSDSGFTVSNGHLSSASALSTEFTVAALAPFVVGNVSSIGTLQPIFEAQAEYFAAGDLNAPTSRISSVGFGSFDSHALSSWLSDPFVGNEIIQHASPTSALVEPGTAIDSISGSAASQIAAVADSVWYSEDPNFIAPPEPQDFTTLGGKWGSSGTFGTAGGTVTWSIAGAGLTNQTGATFFTGSTVALSSFLPADFVTQITNAFAAWSEVANISFTQVADDGGNFGVGTTANIRIGGGFIDGFNANGSVVGRAFGPPSGGNANTIATNGDLVFDSGDAGIWDDALLFATALHEIGHTLGLDHVPQDNPTAVMNPTLHISLPLQPDDIAGIGAVYERPVNPI